MSLRFTKGVTRGLFSMERFSRAGFGAIPLKPRYSTYSLACWIEELWTESSSYRLTFSIGVSLRFMFFGLRPMFLRVCDPSLASDLVRRSDGGDTLFWPSLLPMMLENLYFLNCVGTTSFKLQLGREGFSVALLISLSVSYMLDERASKNLELLCGSFYGNGIIC